jgi:hypothetical protein
LNGITEYIITSAADGKTLHGGNYYRMHLPQGIPSCKFWSVIVYDYDSGLVISTDQPWPSVHSNCKDLHCDQNGSVDIYFGPGIPSGLKNKEHNYIKTIPGKAWKTILRFYEPQTDLGENGWKPGKIELIQ